MLRRTLIGLAAASTLISLSPAFARDAKVGAIQIQHPWIRPTPPGAPTGGGYVTLVNTGSTPDRLVGGSTPAAGRLEIHEMSMDGSIMRMRKLDNGVELPPGATVTLKPGAMHLMLIGLKAPLKVGDRTPVTLNFEKAGAVKVEFAVETPPPAMPGHGGMAH